MGVSKNKYCKMGDRRDTRGCTEEIYLIYGDVLEYWNVLVADVPVRLKTAFKQVVEF